MTEKRKCGECTACCRTHAIFELGKPAGTWCPHCEIGKGCGVYGKHPATCQGFECFWLAGWGRTEDRPDKVRLVIDLQKHFILGKIVCLYEAGEWGLNSPYARETTRLNLEVGTSVLHIPLVGKPVIYLPEGKWNEVSHLTIGGPEGVREIEVAPFVRGRF